MRRDDPRAPLVIRRALLSVSDKEGLGELARALADAGAEIVATGKTAEVIRGAGCKVTPIEQVSGSPEAFRGRMKTLSFPVCSGILYRRGDEGDEKDLARLSIQPIDCVVVNFYPFEKAAARAGVTPAELIEEIDVGGPTLVRAAAKNAPDVLVLTRPGQYGEVIRALRETKSVPRALAERCASESWDRVAEYDVAIQARFGGASTGAAGGAEGRLALRYGENPHQKGYLEIDSDSPIGWPAEPSQRLTAGELSYNNILDVSAAYNLASELVGFGGGAASGVVIVKHNNPCGVSLVPGTDKAAQMRALEAAWAGDPVSAFGGVVVFTHPLEEETAQWLAERFIEMVAAPGLHKDSPALQILTAKRKGLKAVPVLRWGGEPPTSSITVPGGRLFQTADTGVSESFNSATKLRWPAQKERLARFGIAVCRSLKSNAVALVRELPKGELQLVGSGQGQPNRVEALRDLAIPRARRTLEATGGQIEDCVLVSDAFFPFRDTVDVAASAGVRWIIQPGGSIRDAESVQACDESGVAMAFTGVRHFRH